MTEKRYYVKLANSSDSWGANDVLNLETDCNKISFDNKTQSEFFKTEFTKHELSKILNGALYKPYGYYYKNGLFCPENERESESMGKFGQIMFFKEWVNPMFRLKEVEDE